MGLVTEYPFWFILFCLLMAGIYTFVLYYRRPADAISKGLFRLLSVLRFLSVFLISFLLLSPLVKRQTKTVEKPVILFAQDNSASPVLSGDSVFLRKDYPAKVQSLLKTLGRKYEVVTYSFSDQARPGLKTDFTGKMTNISAFFDEMKVRYANRNVGAIILATDGIFNQGMNPYYAAENVSYPVYAVTLGDTILQRDLLVRRVTYNRQAFLGDKFPVEVQVDATRCPGTATRLTLSRGSDIIETREIPVAGTRFSKKIMMLVEAKQSGMQHYTVTLSPVDGEFTLLNNRQDLFVDVKDSRQKIAILYDSPHPDVGALVRALETGLRYEVTESRFDQFTADPAGFDLVILNQVPSVAGSYSLDRILKAKTSLLYILGSQSDLFAFNKLNTGLQITGSRITWSEAQPLLNESFPLFTIDSKAKQVYEDWPPLQAPFATYQSGPLSDVLFYQKIGNVISGFPLVIFFEDATRKTGVITGENIWRWRIADYIRSGNYETFDELVNKIVQLLSVRGDKSFFRVKLENKFFENEPVEFNVELYNESYELVNQPDVSLVITDEAGKTYPFVLSRTTNAYSLNAGVFPVGNYTYTASVTLGKNTYRKQGGFMIAPVNLEALDLVADHSLLNRITNAHDGRTISAHNLDSLAGMILNRSDIRSVSYAQLRYRDLVTSPWIFALILLFLSVEWALRKRSGI